MQLKHSYYVFCAGGQAHCPQAAAGKSQKSTISKSFRCFCTQRALGSAHTSLPFLMTRLLGKKQC